MALINNAICKYGYQLSPVTIHQY